MTPRPGTAPGPGNRLADRRRAEPVLIAAAAITAFVVLSYLYFPWHRSEAAAVPLPHTVSISATGLAPVHVPAGFTAHTLAISPQHVTAPIDTVDVTADDSLTIPGDVHRVGWYRGSGPLDATTGSVLIAGHVNYVGQGTGALGRIGQLKPGDPIVTRGAGAPQAWRVISLTSYLKSDGLPAAIFRSGGRRQLTLVTCGGTLDTSRGSYLSNIVVIAAPVRTIVG